MNKTKITQHQLKNYLSYNKDTGVFSWTKNIGSKKIGDIAGSNDNGYIAIRIKGRKYRASHLAWLYMYGRFPEKTLDHINGVKTDNSIKNLREASQLEQQINLPLFKNNTSGYSNIYVLKNNRYYVAVQKYGKKFKSKVLTTIEEALDTRQNFLRAHNFDPYHGEPSEKRSNRHNDRLNTVMATST